MPTDYINAQDEMFVLFLTAWNAQTDAVIGYVPEVRFQNIVNPGKPDSSKYWARVSVQTVDERQTTLSSAVKLEPGRRYTTNGLIFIQVFAPLSDVAAGRNGQKLADIAKKAFRGKTTPGKVWFLNGRVQELPSEEQFARFNVVTEYQYDELS